MLMFLTIVHVVVCLVLIAVILLQAGRGEGFADVFGGGGSGTSTIFGTQANTFMTRATAVCAVAFLATSLVLVLLSRGRTSSLIDRNMTPIVPVTGQTTDTDMPLETVGDEAAVPLQMPTMPEELPVPEAILPLDPGPIEPAAASAEDRLPNTDQR